MFIFELNIVLSAVDYYEEQYKSWMQHISGAMNQHNGSCGKVRASKYNEKFVEQGVKRIVCRKEQEGWRDVRLVSHSGWSPFYKQQIRQVLSFLCWLLSWFMSCSSCPASEARSAQAIIASPVFPRPHLAFSLESPLLLDGWLVLQLAVCWTKTLLTDRSSGGKFAGDFPADDQTMQ